MEDGKFKPGEKGKGGRKKGSQNNLTKLGKETLLKAFGYATETLKEDIRSLTERDRMNLVNKYLEFMIPKTQRIDADIEVSVVKIGVEGKSMKDLVEEVNKDEKEERGGGEK